MVAMVILTVFMTASIKYFHQLNLLEESITNSYTLYDKASEIRAKIKNGHMNGNIIEKGEKDGYEIHEVVLGNLKFKVVKNVS